MSHRPRRGRTLAAAGIGAALAATLAACSSSSGSTTPATGSSSAAADTGAGAGAGSAAGVAPVSNGASQVAVTLTSDGGGTCTLDNSTAKAGPVTFTVTAA